MKNREMQNNGNNPNQEKGNRSQSDVQVSRQGQGTQRGREQQGFPTLFNSFFGNDFPNLLGDFPSYSRLSRSLPAVNIRERRDEFLIDVAVPGMKKEDFDIKVEGNTLQISAEKSYERNEEEENYTRREFEQSSFARYFDLPDSVNPEQINAKYTDGVLCITLPKKEEAKAKPPRKISIS